MIDLLPTEILIKILKYLDYKDLIGLSQTHSRLKELTNTEELWKTQSFNYWNSTELSPEESDWKTHFSNQYLQNGRYIDCYKDIKAAWDKIVHFINKNFPAVGVIIKEGASETDLNEAETKIGLEYTDDLRCSLRIRNGQRLTKMGLYGSVFIQNHYRSEYILDVDTITTCQSMFDGCVPITICIDSGVAQFLALKDANGLKKGTVFYPCDVHSWSGTRHFCAFITANSYFEWLTTYANQLEAEEFLVDSRLLRFHKSTEASKTTNFVTVTVRTCFMPELSSIKPPNFFHTYRIRMSMSSDAPKHESCQLETRHWIVIDEEGREERVEGPGVVGEFPTMRPNEDFTWTSATSFKTTYGSMKGHFTMRNLQTGAKITIECPTFHMKCLPYVSADNRETDPQ